MILVTGSITARADCLDDLLALCLEHVKRSRLEPGCISHAVHRGVENPLKLVFIEEWEDREALIKHFAVPASAAFVRAARLLADGRPVMHIYDASRIEGQPFSGK